MEYKIENGKLLRYSKSKGNRWIPVEDMNKYHIINALRQELKNAPDMEAITSNLLVDGLMWAYLGKFEEEK